MYSPISSYFASALVLVAALTGCTALHMDTPDGFLVIDESRSEIKATSSDSALLWARTFDDDYEGGNLSFWFDTLYNDLIDNRGYVLIEQKEARHGGGANAVEGHELLLETTAKGALQKYLIYLFYDSGTICTVEFVGREEPFEKHVDSVREAVRSLRF